MTKKIEPNHWVVASQTYPKTNDPDYHYCEWRLESDKGYKKKKDAQREGVRIRQNAELFMNWGSDDDDSSCDEWNTYEMGEQNYDDDEDQTIMVIRYSDYLKMSGKSS